MKVLSRLDSNEVNVDVRENVKYGIMLSGGIDSSMVLYFALADAKAKGINIDIQPFSILKHDQSYKYVDSIIDYFNHQFNTTIPYTVLVGNANLHHTIQGSTAVGEVFRKYPSIGILFSGLNQNPPEPWGDPKWVKPNRPNPSYSIAKMKFPFLHLYKTHIIDLMFEYGQEELMNLTHTCTELTDGRCDVCFQCNERAWAFEQLGRIDTGKL